MTDFDYQQAFSRNTGWVTPDEQLLLRSKKIAIAGLGGVGGKHLLTLTRLGIGNFHIADPDVFEQVNFNRQAGANMKHVGVKKSDTLKSMALDINPELNIRTFPEGINSDNVDAFLDGADIYLDGLDYFVVNARRMVFQACAEKGIPAVTAAPLGMGSAILNFLPGKMTFEEYFRLEGHTEDEQLIRFLIGLSPRLLQRPYLIYPQAVDFKAQKGPSTPMATDLCAGLAATQVLKILTGRGKVLAAPYGIQMDAFRNRCVTTWRPLGNNNPLQRLAIRLATRILAKK